MPGEAPSVAPTEVPAHTSPRDLPHGLLAFDTATERMVVAACGPAGAATWQGPGGPAASAGLLPQIEGVLARAGLAWADVRAIAFGAGPGAFTGLRTACAVAQGLGLGLGRPLLPVDSLAIVAEASPWRDGPVWVAMDARMDEAYAAAYRVEDGGWTATVAPALYTLPALAAAWAAAPPVQVTGNALSTFGDRLPAGGARRWDGQDDDRAAALLRCAAQAWRRGAQVDAADALPLYLRDRVALTTAERLARRAA